MALFSSSITHMIDFNHQNCPNCKKLLTKAAIEAFLRGDPIPVESRNNDEDHPILQIPGQEQQEPQVINPPLEVLELQHTPENSEIFIQKSEIVDEDHVDIVIEEETTEKEPTTRPEQVLNLKNLRDIQKPEDE